MALWVYTLWECLPKGGVGKSKSTPGGRWFTRYWESPYCHWILDMSISNVLVRRKEVPSPIRSGRRSWKQVAWSTHEAQNSLDELYRRRSLDDKVIQQWNLYEKGVIPEEDEDEEEDIDMHDNDDDSWCGVNKRVDIRLLPWRFADWPHMLYRKVNIYCIRYEPRINPAVCNNVANWKPPSVHGSLVFAQKTYRNLSYSMDLIQIIICPIAHISRIMIEWIDDWSRTFEYLCGGES